MGDQWKDKDTWVNPIDLLFGGPIAPQQHRVENTTTGESRQVEVQYGQTLGDAIANGQFVDDPSGKTIIDHVFDTLGNLAPTEAANTDSQAPSRADNDSSDAWTGESTSDSADSGGGWDDSTSYDPPTSISPRDSATRVDRQKLEAIQIAAVLKASPAGRRLEREQWTELTDEDIEILTMLDRMILPHVGWWANADLGGSHDRWKQLARRWLEVKTLENETINLAYQQLLHEASWYRWYPSDKIQEWTIENCAQKRRDALLLEARETERRSREMKEEQSKKLAAERLMYARAPQRQFGRFIGFAAFTVIGGAILA